MRTAQVARLNFPKKPTLVFLLSICSMSGLLSFVQVKHHSMAKIFSCSCWFIFKFCFLFVQVAIAICTCPFPLDNWPIQVVLS